MKKIHILPTIVLSLFVLGIFFTQVKTFTSNTQHATTLKSDIAVPLSGDQLNARVASLPPPTEKVFLMGGALTAVPSGLSNDIWSSSNMTSWLQISPNGSNPQKWDRRATYGLGANVYFNNKIWIMGGVNPIGPPWYNNEVWSSSDGINWNLVTNNPGWGTRIVEPVVFNNMLWVIGGNTANTPNFSYGDVWSSPDGINWTQVLAAAPWGVRSMTNPISFNNKLWIMGGWNGQPGPISVNDVWSSPDGINWTQTTSSAPWSVRFGHSTVVFNGKMWVLGGSDAATGNKKADIWSSPDGINWTSVTTVAPWGPRDAFTSLVFDGKMWVLGGADNTIGIQNDVWSSLDGINWTQVVSSAPWPARYFHQTVVTPLTFGLPDIIVTDLKWQEPIAGVPIGPGHNNPISQSTSNKYILFTATIKNDSAVPLAIPANHKMKLFSGTAPSTLVVNNINFGTSVTIPPQGTHTFNFSSQATPNMRATAGTYTLTLRADTSNVVVEKNENNNRIVKTLVIQ